jgi:hypothetical protein
MRVSALVLALAGCTTAPPRSSGDEFGTEFGSDETLESPQDLPDASESSDASETDASETDASETDASETDASETGEPASPPLYVGGRIHSPINAFVATALHDIRANDPRLVDDVFMKVGASSTVNQNTLYCFALDVPELDVHEPTLGPTLDYFLMGDAAGTTPFDRDTLAAEVGRTAGWAITGDPSPLVQELDALTPSLALVHYGANDMQQGITYAAALPSFHANMSDLLDQLIARGVVPIVFGLSRRLDQDGADLWVPSFDAVSRALAQARRVPFVDLQLALEELPGYGLSGDGLHLEAFSQGACIFTPAGLQHGYNVRNLIALEVLDRVRQVLLLGEPELEPDPVATLSGAGTLDQPFEIAALPFTDARDTSESSSFELDVYTGCSSGADESGPELVYRLELAEPRAIRAFVLDRAGVDVDIQLLAIDPLLGVGEDTCLERDDTLVQTTLAAGSYAIVVDTYVAGGIEQAGPYTLVVHECRVDDPDCA